jgi:homocysteine S-methyltransferase
LETGTTTMNPILPFLERQGVVILDGGLATELEARGFALDDELWSARLLVEHPEAIRRLHRDYLEAGSDCVTSASYQATFEGFAQHGLAQSEAAGLLRLSVELAREARDDFWKEASNRRARLRPLVAASVGPYGAYLADGSEYSGDYGLDEAALVDFHRRRFEVIAASGADLLACETIPSRVEARALARLLADSSAGPPGTAARRTAAWLSFSCRDGRCLSDGSDLAATVAEIEAEIEDSEGIVAFGVNCTAPRHVSGLISRLRQVTKKPIAVYPNSGEVWDGAGHCWAGLSSPLDLAAASAAWHAAGAKLLGGCCRTGPEQVRQIRERLLGGAGKGRAWRFRRASQPLL